MITRLTHATILARDQDEALRWYTEKLGFEKRADDTSMPGFRWLTVAPKGQKEVWSSHAESETEALCPTPQNMRF